jgi:hypothetical protein
MPDIKQLTLAEAERQLKMNLSLIEMLKGNTDLEADQTPVPLPMLS